MDASDPISPAATAAQAPPSRSSLSAPPPSQGLPVPGLLFFCTIGLVADCFNFNAALGETFLAAGRFKAGEWDLGLLGAASSLGYMMTCLAAGVLSERVGRRPMIVLALTLLTAVYLRVPSVRTVGELDIMALLRAAATAMLWPPLMAWMTEITETPALPRVLGRYNMSWSCGILIGFALSGWTSEHLGYAAPFHLSAGLSVSLLLFVLLVVPRSMTHRPGGARRPSADGTAGKTRRGKPPLSTFLPPRPASGFCAAFSSPASAARSRG